MAMTVTRINIDQQFAQIGIRSGNARMQISKPEGQMSIQTNTPQMEINTQLPRFTVDRQRINNETGLAGPLAFARQFSNRGRQAAFGAIATYAAEGDFIANPNIPGDKSIPMMVSNKMKRYFQKPETNIGLMPSRPAELTWDKGYINVNWSRHNISVNWTGSNTAQISVDKSYPAEVFLSRQPYIRVSAEQAEIGSGRYIDRTI